MTLKLILDFEKLAKEPNQDSQRIIKKMTEVWCAIRSDDKIPDVDSSQGFKDRLIRFYESTLENWIQGDTSYEDYDRAISQVDTFFGYTPKL